MAPPVRIPLTATASTINDVILKMDGGGEIAVNRVSATATLASSASRFE